MTQHVSTCRCSVDLYGRDSSGHCGDLSAERCVRREPALAGMISDLIQPIPTTYDQRTLRFMLDLHAEIWAA